MIAKLSKPRPELLRGFLHVRHDQSIRHSRRKCRITAASVLGIEIANEVHKSGTRLDPIIIGTLVSSLHADDF
jgi:hypothetical protein